MITDDLIAYIQAQRNKKISEEVIRSRLVTAGWHQDDVAEAFRKLTPPEPIAPKPITPVIETPISIPVVSAPATPAPQAVEKPAADPYRELPIVDEPKDAEEKLWIPEPAKTGPVSYVIPAPEPKKEIVPPAASPVSAPAIKPIFATSFSEANTQAVKPSAPLQPIVPIAPAPVPVSIPISAPVSKPAPSLQMEAQSLELMPTLKPKTEGIPVFEASASMIPEPAPLAAPLPQGFSSFADQKMSTRTPDLEGPTVDSLPRGALLHSYQQVLTTATKATEEKRGRRNHRLIKWLVAILVASLLGGAVFALANDYIEIPFLTNLSFIKKDPKVLLLNAPIMLGKLESYKIETTATLTAPSFADITAGLVSGDAVDVKDRESVTLTGKGSVQNGITAPTFDYIATLTSSLFKNPIVTDIKYDKGTSFVTTPDTREILGADAPPVSLVAVPKGEFDSFISLLPEIWAHKLAKIDVDNLLSVGIPSYLNSETASILKDFVANVSVIEKSPENIKGMPSYHYELTADRQATKQLLTDMSHVFLDNLSAADQSIVADGLGAATLDSFEVWVGKDDGNVHQYSFTFSVPLSKVLNLEDKGIAGNMVSLHLVTTYYDFNVPNTIPIPTDAISTTDFFTKITDAKIKNAVSSFKPLASNLHNALGTYGAKTNTTGSCMNPPASTLFSPTGHSKGAAPAVSAIAQSMTDLLAMTNGTGSCYSTPSAWALSAPLASDPATSYCADSTGALMTLTTPLTGPICK